MTHPTPDNSSQATDRYRLLRSQVEFEHSLIVQRLNWLVASQSFLFTAYAITLNAPVQPAWAVLNHHSHIIFHLIPLVALTSSLLIYAGVLGGILAQKNLRRFFQRQFDGQDLAHLPPIQGATQTHWLGLCAPLGLPPVFAIVWIYLFVHGII